MIIEYHRPTSTIEALALLARAEPITYPMGGGTVLTDRDEKFAVVDLQSLGLGAITVKGNTLQMGATATLQQVLDHPGLADDFYAGIKLEATTNIRQMATIAGTIVTADGRSALACVLLAMDANLEILQKSGKTAQERLGAWLLHRTEAQRGEIISRIDVPVNVKLAFEYVARTPADKPIICVAVAQWPSGRTRLALGGWGSAPVFGMDGPESEGAESAARSAYSQAGDVWASAEYREDIAGILTRRCLEKIRSV